MNAAGTVKTLQEFERFVDLPVASLIVGSYTVEERTGNAGSVYFATAEGSVNSLGLPGPAMTVWKQWLPAMRSRAEDTGKRLWVSIAGFNPPEYGVLASTAAEAGAHVLEVNLGCPNVWEAGTQKPIVSFSADQTSKVLDELKRVVGGDIVFGVKLSPILDPVLLAAVDQVIVASGVVSFVTTSNTVPNCFAMGDRGSPAIDFGKHLGGLGGRALKWIAQGQVIQHADHLAAIPIIAVGGIRSGQDLLEYLSPEVGASACQVATAVWEGGPQALVRIAQEYADGLVQ